MKTTGIVRRIDDLGRVVIPKEIRRNMGLNDGDALEIIYTNGTVSIRKYKKSFEQCAIEWFDNHIHEMNACAFKHEYNYTFCIVNPEGSNHYMPTRGGFAKCFKDDAWDHRIGKVAAYANAMGYDLNEMIGYEG